jgi:cytochrome oxidase Cu insertion factor (SCO1/SenC/PrrC family)
VFGVVALLSGIFPYALLTSTGKLPAGLRDNPWPFELVAVLAAAATLGLLVVAYRQKRARVVATVFGLLATLSTAVFISLIHVISYELPPPPRDLAIGSAAPDFTLPDEAGRMVSLGSLQGHPSLLVFYRGFW